MRAHSGATLQMYSQTSWFHSRAAMCIAVNPISFFRHGSALAASIRYRRTACWFQIAATMTGVSPFAFLVDPFVNGTGGHDKYRLHARHHPPNVDVATALLEQELADLCLA